MNEKRISSMDNLYEAINVVLGSTKSYWGSAEDCKVITGQLPDGEQCISTVNFCVTNPARKIALSLLECIILEESGERYLQGVVVSHGQLVYKYYVRQNGQSLVCIDVDGPWKDQLLLVAEQLKEE